MDAEQEIRNAQQDWARSRGIPFHSRGYVLDVEDNLWQPLSPRARQGFERGAGSELSGHMRALHSSSALAVNFFDYWTDRDKTPILSALGIDSEGGHSLDFEAQFYTGLGGTPPHLDVAITYGTGCVIAVESKFTEHLKRSTTGKSNFTTAYFPQVHRPLDRKGPARLPVARRRAVGRGTPWRQAAVRVPGPAAASQARSWAGDATGKRVQSLLPVLRLAWGWDGGDRREVDLFDECVGGEIRFKALTYQEVFEKLRGSGQAGSEFLNYLETRYFTRMA